MGSPRGRERDSDDMGDRVYPQTPYPTHLKWPRHLQWVGLHQLRAGNLGQGGLLFSRTQSSPITASPYHNIHSAWHPPNTLSFQHCVPSVKSIGGSIRLSPSGCSRVHLVLGDGEMVLTTKGY